MREYGIGGIDEPGALGAGPTWSQTSVYLQVLWTAMGPGVHMTRFMSLKDHSGYYMENEQ